VSYYDGGSDQALRQPATGRSGAYPRQVADLTEILDVRPRLGDGARKTLEVKADKMIVAHLEPSDLVEVRDQPA
jgi:hypothetical protein